MSRDTYASAVIGVLAGDFPDLNDPVIAGIVRKYVSSYAEAQDRGRHLEVIVDDPMFARWRLTGNRDKPGQVRLGCWYMNPSSEIREQQERLNAALDALDPDMEEQQ